MSKKANTQPCPHCDSTKIKKNGHTSYGKQNYQWTSCLRQFVESGQDWFISQSDKDFIDKLLLERISLAGICRVCGVGQSWLQRYIKSKYESCPDDLNADLLLPEMESYLSVRMDEEIICQYWREYCFNNIHLVVWVSFRNITLRSSFIFSKF